MTLGAKDRDAFVPVQGMRVPSGRVMPGLARFACVSVLAASCLWAASVAAQAAGTDAASGDGTGLVGQLVPESPADGSAAGTTVVSPVPMRPVIEENPASMPSMPVSDAVPETLPVPAPVSTPARASATAPAPAPAFAPVQAPAPASQPLRPIGRVVSKSRVQVGRVVLDIPAPRGYAVLTPAEIASERRVRMATDSGNLLLLGLVPVDLAQRLQEETSDHRSLKVYTPQVFSSQSVSAKAFQSLRQSMRQQIVDAGTRGVTGNRLLDGMGGIIPGPERRSPEARIVVRPVHADSERSLMYSVLVTDAVPDESGGVREMTHVATTAAVLLHDRVVFMTAQAPGAAELDWSRAVMRNWVAATLAANAQSVAAEALPDDGPRLKSSPLDTLLQVNTGIEWLRSGQILGLLLVVGLLMYLRKLMQGR